MPIKPEKKKLYPENWKDIVAWIKKRSGDVCELCGVSNGMIVGRWKNQTAIWKPFSEYMPSSYWKRVRIVLTTAHINQNPTDNRPENLLHLCQHCHNRIDLPYRMENAAKTRADRRGKKFFEEGKP